MPSPAETAYLDNQWEGNDVRITADSVLNGKSVSIVGLDNYLEVASACKLRTPITIKGNGNRLVIGPRCVLNGIITIVTDGASVIIGEKTTALGLTITMHEAQTILIGEDCMFSGGIWMDCSDIHSIIDLKTGRRINPALPISIERHVWIGRSVTILKGSKIGADSVIAAGAVVKGEIPSNSIAAGVPARVVKSGITWDRKRLPM